MIMDAFDGVLGDLDAAGEEEHGDLWPTAVKDSLVSLTAAYKVLTVADRSPIDYRALCTQAAYVFAYGMPRAGFTYELLMLHRSQLGRPLFDSESIKITSVGGGPASELVGLVKYLKNPEAGEAVKSIHYRILDCSAEWANVAELIESTLDAMDSGIKVEIEFGFIDLTDGNSTSAESLQDDDLVIISYVICEVCALDEDFNVEDNVRGLLRTLGSGGKVLYVDSASYPFYSFFNRCKTGVRGLRQVNEVEGEIAFDEDIPEIFQMYADELDRYPRMNCNIVSKLLERT